MRSSSQHTGLRAMDSFDKPPTAPPDAQAAPKPKRQVRAAVRRVSKWIAVLVAAVLGAAALFVLALTSGLPHAARIRDLADKNNGTTILDDRDRPAFVIDKEESIDVSLSRVAPDVVHAVIAVEDAH